MLPLLESWPTLAGQVRRARNVALFLDFDGTLAPLVPCPQDAAAGRATRAALSRLAFHPKMRIWVISGRRRADLESRLPISRLHHLGALGWESGDIRLPPETRRILEQARKCILRRLNGTAGVMVEAKEIAFALHYRGAPVESVIQAGRILEQTVSETRGALRAVPGELVWEVLPREIRNKGHAIRKLRGTWGPNAFPIYIGNDQTDEPAFSAVRGGITARVGRSANSRARYYLRTTGEVRQFLERLLEDLPA